MKGIRGVAAVAGGCGCDCGGDCGIEVDIAANL